MKRAILMMVMFISFCGLMAVPQTVKRDRTYLRSGAGSYHSIVKELPIGTKVDVKSEDDGWLEVSHLNQTGYIAATSVVEIPKRYDSFANMKAPQKGLTSHGISAGVKGFGEKFSGELKGNASFLDYATMQKTDEKAYKLFVKQTYKDTNAKAYRKLYALPKRNIPDYYTEAAEGFGLAVASVIANMGIYKNPDLTTYVNFVGQNVVTASDAYDIPYRFFILDISQPNAYACPGGYVFITKGMLQILDSEAELAFVLAHEIAHISRFHGMIESKLRENQIGAESLFDELDQDTKGKLSDKASEIEKELEADIKAMYETLISGRLDAYEEEADNLGMLYCARSGYDPNAAKTLVYRLKNTRYESNNEHYRRQSIAWREAWINKESAKYQKAAKAFIVQQERFRQQKQLLDRY